MTDLQFDALMIIAENRWGKKAYPSVVKMRIWSFAKDLPPKSFEEILYLLIDSSRQAPMPKEFVSLCRIERERLGLAKTRELSVRASFAAKCRFCGDSGNLFIERKLNHENWAKWFSGCIRCDCQAGLSRPNTNGPQWSAIIAESYERIAIYEPRRGPANDCY